MQLYLVRHGQSFNNALPDGNSNDRVHDPELTEIGQKQAEAVATHFAQADDLYEYASLAYDDPARQQPLPYGITHVYSSPMKRALETAKPIAKALGLKHDLHLGVYEFGGIFVDKDGVITAYGGMTRNEMTASFPDANLPDWVTDEGWYDVKLAREPISHSMGRAIDFVREMTLRAQRDEHRNDRIIVVAHGGFIAFALKAFVHTLPSFNYMWHHYNTAITRINFHRDRPVEIMYVNRINHLSPDIVT